MSILGYGLIAIGAIVSGMGLLSRKWKQPIWLRPFIMGIILVAAGIYLLLYPPA